MNLYQLAKGGIGRVHLAVRREGSFERLYAIKTLHAHYRDDDSVREMFLQEARVAGLLRHSNVVSVIDVGEGPEGPFLVMDYVEGIPLSRLMKSLSDGELFPVQLCVRIVSQVARGLHAAHELKGHGGVPLRLVHRDVSPQNILLGFDGVVRVTDFGIAKAFDIDSQTTTGILKGKLGYMSPEQLRFETPDRRADLYALGVLLFELLAGRRLYRGGIESDAPKEILQGEVPDISSERRDVPPALVSLLFDLLAKQRELRPKDAREVQMRLDEIIEEITEPPLAIEDYLEEQFADMRLAMRERVTAALAQAQATGEFSDSGVDSTGFMGIPGSTRSRRRRRESAIVLIAAAVLAIGVGVGWLVARTAPAAEPDALLSAAPSPVLSGETPPGIGQADEPVADGTDEGLAAPGAAPVGEAGQTALVVETEAVDAGAPSAQKRRSRIWRRRSSRRQQGNEVPSMEVSERDPEGWWGWQ